MFGKILICLNLINIFALGYDMPLKSIQNAADENFRFLSSKNANFLKKTSKAQNIYYSPLTLQISDLMNELKFCYGISSSNDVHCEYEKMKARRLNSNLGKFAKYQNVICNVSTILVIDKQFESSNNRFLKYATENGIKIINAQDKSTDSLFEEINKWVSEKSKDRHPHLDPDNHMATTDAMQMSILSFKSYWNSPKIIRNEKKKFMVKEDDEVHVRMITFEEPIAYHDFKDLEIEAISLPYKGKEFSVVVILPYEGVGLNVFSSFTDEAYKYVFSELEHVDLSRVNYEIPLLNSSNITFTNMGTALNEDNTFGNVPEFIIYEETFKINFHVNRPYAMFMYHKNTTEILFAVFIRNPSLDDVHEKASNFKVLMLG